MHVLAKNSVVWEGFTMGSQLHFPQWKIFIGNM